MREPRGTAPGRQRGVALLTALVVVAAATVLVSGMLWRQAIAERKLENRAAIGQARWLARSALDWARLALLQDALSSVVDHYGEPWAIPLEETRVSDPDAPADTADVAYVSGRILDAQARMNLTDLEGGGKLNDQAYAAFARLMSLVGGSDAMAASMAQRMIQIPKPVNYAALAREMAAQGLVPRSVLNALDTYVVVLPTPTPINLNTASAEVIAASYDKMTLDEARTLVESRERAYFNQVSDAALRLASNGPTPTALTDMAVATHYFEAHGHVRYGRVEFEVKAMLQRDSSGVTRLIDWQEN